MSRPSEIIITLKLFWFYQFVQSFIRLVYTQHIVFKLLCLNLCMFCDYAMSVTANFLDILYYYCTFLRRPHLGACNIQQACLRRW